MDLDGKRIVVTGGGGHLGKAIAQGLAARGASVLICGRTEEALSTVSGGAIEHVVADVSTDEGLERLSEAAGMVDGWVNNAYAGPSGNQLDAPRPTVRDVVTGGLADVISATQTALSRMNEGGSIVNIGSMYGIVSPVPSVYAGMPEVHSPPAYGAAKAGVIQFTRYAACHLASNGIRVNCVSPGPFPISGEPDFERRLAERVPLGRVGSAEEIVGPVAFLISNASSYVTGHNLVVDGGWTAW